MDATPEHPISIDLQAGIDALQEVAGVERSGEVQWIEGQSLWAIPCRLTVDASPTKHVPATSRWWFLVETTYPFGSITVAPEAEDGITATFPHQRFNGSPADDSPWRAGNICTETPGRTVLRQEVDDEPYRAESRLAWHAGRSLRWLKDAATGDLVSDGEPYEVPDFPSRGAEVVCFSEAADSCQEWQALAEPVGFVSLRRAPGTTTRLVVDTFRGSVDPDSIAQRAWGTSLSETEVSDLGLWVLLSGPPVLDPWQAPGTWGELREVCANLGLDLDAQLRPLFDSIRDGTPHVLMLGFPILEVAGGDPSMIWWQGLRLPVLSSGKRHRDGFRSNELGYWRRDRDELLAQNIDVQWLQSENWAESELGSRGTLSIELRESHAALIGAGALGASVAELLVRGGVNKLTLIDGDRFAPGNLVRHTLDMRDLGSSKAVSLAHRLNLASPHATISGVDASFPSAEAVAVLAEASLVIDATANDAVLEHLSRIDRPGTVFVSISVGAFAKRLFFYVHRSNRFDSAGFRQRAVPLLLEERELVNDSPFPREAVGCWNPVFPARADDIWILASSAAKELEEYVASHHTEPRFVVFEQLADAQGRFTGVTRRLLE